jgi:hypothetical protein
MSDTSAGDVLRSLFSGRSISAETHARIESEQYLEDTKKRAPRVYLLASILSGSALVAVIFTIPAAAWLVTYATGGTVARLDPGFAWVVACIGSSFALAWFGLSLAALWTKDRSAPLVFIGAVAHGFITSVGVLSLI